MTQADDRVVEGCKLPSRYPLTDNEWRWIETIRAFAGDSDPVLTYERVQALRLALGGGHGQTTT